MNHRGKKLLAVSLSIIMMLTAFPLAAMATSAETVNIAEVFPNTSGNGWSFDNDILTVNGGANIIITGETTGGRRIVVSGAAAITLNGVSITELGYEQSPLLLNSGANLSLTLVGVNILKAGDYRAGIHAPHGTTLTIDGTGSLTAEGGDWSAGIGSSYEVAGGIISIGGNANVTATGGSYGAGIGGGYEAGGGIINISGNANITATGGIGGAGIGGGYDETGGSITISGGTVNARGRDGGAGIGGGVKGTGGFINISGNAYVTAIGGAGGAAGIGGGDGGFSGEITIRGGTVIATGGAGGGAGIDARHGRLTMDGNVVVFASSVGGTDLGGERRRGILFIGNNGIFYGDNVTPTNSFTIPGNHTLAIGSGQTLIIDGGITLTNDGEITNRGTITNIGTVINNATGTITNIGTITANGTVTNTGTITNNHGRITSAITYHLDDGEQQDGIWGRYNFGEAFNLPTAPTKANHTFGGWFDNEGLSGNAVTHIPAGNIGHREFWARWVPYTYTITDNVTNAEIYPLSLTHGVAYSGTLTPDEGFSRPSTITVMRGSIDITAHVTYDQGTGAISIPDGQVTGDITISGTATALPENIEPDVAPDITPDIAPDITPDITPDIAPGIAPGYRQAHVDVPQTGVSRGMIFPIIALLLGTACIIGAEVYRRRSKKAARR